MNSIRKVVLVKCLPLEKRGLYGFRPVPLTLAYLHAAIDDLCSVILHDMLVDDNLIEFVESEQPDLIGLSIFSADFTTARRLVPKLKAVAPKALLIAGGAHATFEPQSVLELGTDFVVRSEGELPLRSLISALQNSVDLVTKVPSLSLRRAGSIDHYDHSPIRLVDDLDSIASPRVDSLDMSKYDQFPVLTARGCPYQCSYCASREIWCGKVRFHSPERVLIEVKRSIEYYGAEQLIFADDTFTLNRKRLLEICAGLVELGSPRWAANARVETIDLEVASAMKAAGCQVIAFGLEAGSEAILRRANKFTTVEQMKAAVAACRQVGIRIKTGWMIGLPGSYQEQRESLAVMLALRPDVISIHHFIPMPGTPYWTDPAAYGLSIDRERLLEKFSIDGLPKDTGVTFDYLTWDQAENLVTEMIEVLRREGYQRPHEVIGDANRALIVNTYLDKERLPVISRSQTRN